MSVDVSGQSIEWPLINRLVIEFIGCCGRTGGSWGDVVVVVVVVAAAAAAAVVVVVVVVAVVVVVVGMVVQ